MTKAEYVKSIKTRILIDSPFTQSEITDELVELAIDRSLSLLNRLRPNVIKSYEPLYGPGYTLLQGYADYMDITTVEPYIEEISLDIGTLFYYSTPWTVKSITAQTTRDGSPITDTTDEDDLIDKHRVALKYFKDLTVVYTCMFASHKRRSVQMGEIPFDIKGDQFYSEYDDKLTSITEELVNTTPNMY
ncbi:hypothetical protein YerA41_194c [Yersinia phage YerA41]|nr:hypothetical protein YerA41_194c [Yersinia phage YerA41]